MGTVLVIEDNRTNLKLLAIILEQGGHRVLQASAAPEGLDLVARERPDIILMDVQLPGMDGLEATRRLKADPATRDIPVVALTASCMRGDEERIRDAGCDGYLAKPVRYRDLLDEVEARLPKPPSS